MTEQDLNRLSDAQIEAAWSAGNDAGLGYMIGAENESPSEALTSEGYSYIRLFDTHGDLGYNAVGIKAGRIVAVCGSDGPWAIDITEAVLQGRRNMQIATTIEDVEVPMVKLTTTLYRLRKHHACEERYDVLVAALGDDWPDDRDINLLEILKHTGVSDALMALEATTQNCARVARLIAADIAESVLLPDDLTLHETIRIARLYAVDKAGDTARAAAWTAAQKVSHKTSDVVNWRGVTARETVSADSRATAWGAARSADLADSQANHAEIIERYLLP